MKPANHIVNPTTLSTVYRAGRAVGGALVSAGFAGWLWTQSLATLINDATLLQAWSRSDGTFELSLRGGESLALRADAEAMRSATVAWNGQDAVRLTMTATGGAMGRVVDASGRGISRVVEATSAHGEAIAISRSADDGAFAFAALPAGRYRISADGDQGVATTVDVPAGGVVSGILVKVRQ